MLKMPRRPKSFVFYLLDPVVKSALVVPLLLGLTAFWSKKAPELVTSKGPRPLKTGSCTAVGCEYTEGVNLERSCGLGETPAIMGDKGLELEGTNPRNLACCWDSNSSCRDLGKDGNMWWESSEVMGGLEPLRCLISMGVLPMGWPGCMWGGKLLRGSPFSSPCGSCLSICLKTNRSSYKVQFRRPNSAQLGIHLLEIRVSKSQVTFWPTGIFLLAVFGRNEGHAQGLFSSNHCSIDPVAGL